MPSGRVQRLRRSPGHAPRSWTKRHESSTMVVMADAQDPAEVVLPLVRSYEHGRIAGAPGTNSVGSACPVTLRTASTTS